MRGVELGAILEKTFRSGVLLDGLDGCIGTEFGSENGEQTLCEDTLKPLWQITGDRDADLSRGRPVASQST